MSEKKIKEAVKAMRKPREIVLRPVEIDGLQAMAQARDNIQRRLNDAVAEIVSNRKMDPAKVRVDIDPAWTKLILVDLE